MNKYRLYLLSHYSKDFVSFLFCINNESYPIVLALLLCIDFTDFIKCLLFFVISKIFINDTVRLPTHDFEVTTYFVLGTYSDLTGVGDDRRPFYFL